MKINTVLCPIDFSAITNSVAGLAIQTCQLFGARLVLHYSVEGVPKRGASPVHAEQAEYDDAAKLLQELAGRAPTSIHATTRIKKGRAFKSILELAEELPADLIVMGTRGRGGVDHLILGSTTERVVAHSRCPVLATRDVGHNIILPERGDMAVAGPAQVLVPINFSEHSLKTLAEAYAMMEVLPVSLHLLHVVEPDSWNDMRGATHFNVPEFLGHRLHDAAVTLRALVPRDLENRVQSQVLMGPVADEITGHASRIQARLIIMGVKHQGALKGFLFGATSYGVLRHSPCPVWIVPEVTSDKTSDARKESESYHSKLFDERFSQARSPSTENRGGTGLGLSIVKGILDAHGSQIRVESRPKQGTEVTFHLECVNVKEADQVESPPGSAGAVGS